MSDLKMKLAKARAALIIDQPFFASILLPMPLIESSDIPTMATDGESILFNPEWSDKLTLQETIFVMAHEVLHCVFDHMGRRGQRGPNRWNQAADYVINQILVSDGVGTMPHGGLYNPSLYKQGGETAEGIYKLLPEENENKKAGEKGGALDHVFDSGTDNGKAPTDQAKIAEKSASLKVRVIAAKNAAKMQGKLSAGMDRLVSELVKPKIDWKTELRRFLTKQAKTDFSYARPKRRFLSEDLYLPSLTGQRMGRVFVAVDCSGSVNQKMLDMFSAELNAIKSDLRPESMDVIYFDSSVCGAIESYGPDDTLNLKMRGGGGTDFAPVIQAVNATLASQDAPACLVFLTDLVCDSFGEAPEYPVLWAGFNLRAPYDKAPYGEVLGVNENEN